MGTYKAIKRTHLVYITADEYNKAVLEIDKQRESRRINILSKIPLFSCIGKPNLKKVIKNVTRMQVTKDTII